MLLPSSVRDDDALTPTQRQALREWLRVHEDHKSREDPLKMALVIAGDYTRRDWVERREVGASAVVWWVPDDGKLAGISRRHGDDYYGENPDWADDLPSLDEGS